MGFPLTRNCTTCVCVSVWVYNPETHSIPRTTLGRPAVFWQFRSAPGTDWIAIFSSLAWVVNKTKFFFFFLYWIPFLLFLFPPFLSLSISRRLLVIFVVFLSPFFFDDQVVGLSLFWDFVILSASLYSLLIVFNSSGFFYYCFIGIFNTITVNQILASLHLIKYVSRH
jgi:hypothetical protein